MPPSICHGIKIDVAAGVTGDVLLHRDVLRSAVMDMHMGEGPSNCVEKLVKIGGRLTTDALNSILDRGQAWQHDLALLVGDIVWGTLPEAEQLKRAALRAELLVSCQHGDKLALLSPAAKTLTTDAAAFYLPSTSPHLIQQAVLNAYEAKKEHRRAEAAAVGAALKLSLDFTKQSGENVGEEWLLTVKNENGQTVGKAAGKTANYLDYEDFLREIGQRKNVTAKLLCLDDVVETSSGEYDARSKLLLEWLGGEEVVLDRFHVIHRVNEGFNNHSAHFYRLMVVEQREVISHREPSLEMLIDARLMAGTLKKTCTFRSTQYVWGGTPMTGEEINAHKASGLYHAMLSSSNALVPVVPNPREHVDLHYPLWQAKVAEHIRKSSLASHVGVVVASTDGQTHTDGQRHLKLLFSAGAFVASWAAAPPQENTIELSVSELPLEDGCHLVMLMDGNGKLVHKLQLHADSTAKLSLKGSLSSLGNIDGCAGSLAITLCAAWGSSVEDVQMVDKTFTVPIKLKVQEVRDANNHVLCDWGEFKSRTSNGLKRFKLCSLQRLEIKPYRETTRDLINNLMQHESLMATSSNEHTHRRLASFSGRGRGEKLGVGSMIEGDYIDSRMAAIRLSCGSQTWSTKAALPLSQLGRSVGQALHAHSSDNLLKREALSLLNVSHNGGREAPICMWPTGTGCPVVELMCRTTSCKWLRCQTTSPVLTGLGHRSMACTACCRAALTTTTCRQRPRQRWCS